MPETVTLTAAHWFYLFGVVAVIVTMACRVNVVLPAMVATFLTALVFSGKLTIGLEAIFMAPLVAGKELFNIFLVIAMMTALLNSLVTISADIAMIRPFRLVMRNGHIAYFVLGFASYIVSLFFWPTPTVPLMAGILLPAAIAAGLPPLGGALCIGVAGLGTALSSDYVIRVGPGISAKQPACRSCLWRTKGWFSRSSSAVSPSSSVTFEFGRIFRPRALLTSIFGKRPIPPALVPTGLWRSPNHRSWRSGWPFHHRWKNGRG